MSSIASNFLKKCSYLFIDELVEESESIIYEDQRDGSLGNSLIDKQYLKNGMPITEEIVRYEKSRGYKLVKSDIRFFDLAREPGYSSQKRFITYRYERYKSHTKFLLDLSRLLYNNVPVARRL